MSNYRKNFRFFVKYWEIVAKRGTKYSGLEVFVITSYIFDMLQIEWQMNGWDINELKYLTLPLDCMPDELNPFKFLHNQYAYLDELKNYCTKHNG